MITWLQIRRMNIRQLLCRHYYREITTEANLSGGMKVRHGECHKCGKIVTFWKIKP